ncbi:MAG: universal stress protein [Acidimicrobiales bacterium]
MSIENDPKDEVRTNVDRSHVIVVGVDGSPTSVTALEWAARQAEFTGCALEVIATWEWPSGFGYTAIPSEYRPVDDLEKLLGPIMADLKAKHPGVVASERIIEGHPAPVLVEESHGASLLVVGSRGLGAFAGMLLGSTSKHCVSSAQCPVVVVRHPHD